MGTTLQERVAQLCISTKERERNKTSWGRNGPNVACVKMGRRQSQRKSMQFQVTNQDSVHTTDKRLQQRRRRKPNSTLNKCNVPQISAQETPESKSRAVISAGDKRNPKVQQASQCCLDQNGPGTRKNRIASAIPSHHPSSSSPALLENQSPDQEDEIASSHNREYASDRDLSELERQPLPPSACVPPQLSLRPEVIGPDDLSSHIQTPRGQSHGNFHFPDFLPPPFNSWSLSQLAVFYNMEGRGAPRPRPVGPLERYLERLLRLEWLQVRTVQEESGTSSLADVLPICHGPHCAASSRLSSPKRILQCQRAFPLTFLSALDSHSALLSGCACTLCRLRYASCSKTCCRSAYGHSRLSGMSPVRDCRNPSPLPKRSYSESRAHSSDKGSVFRARRFSSPVRGSSPVRASSHLKRMQALGNIRNPVHGATTVPHSTVPDSCARAGRDFSAGGNAWSVDHRSAGLRSGSEQRRGRTETSRNVSENRRSGSECRKGFAERRRAAGPKERDIKPDAVAAIMNNLTMSKHSSLCKPSRPKQVEFVT